MLKLSLMVDFVNVFVADSGSVDYILSSRSSVLYCDSWTNTHCSDQLDYINQLQIRYVHDVLLNVHALCLKKRQ